MIAALQDGALSFETIVCAVQSAISDYHLATHGPTGDKHSYDCEMCVVATFPGTAIYEMKGKMYRVGYAIEGTTAMIEGEPTEVLFTAVPGERAEAKEPPTPEPTKKDDVPAIVQEEMQTLLEMKPAGLLSAAKLDRENRIIRDTVLITKLSSNGGGRVYEPLALQQIARLAEGMPAYLNHTTPDKAFKARPVEEMLGKHKNVRYDAANDRVLSDLHILEHQADFVFSVAQDLGDQVGNSVVSKGQVVMEGGKEHVKQIVALRSGDLVSDPATTRGLFEHMETWRQNHPTSKESDDMDTPKLTVATILEAVRADAVFAEHVKRGVAEVELKQLTEANEKLGAANVQIKTLTDEKTQLTADLAEAKKVIDGYKSAEAVAKKRDKMVAVLAEHGLGKKYAKTEGAISDVFRSQLMEADEDKWAAIMDAHLASLDAVLGAKPPAQAPESKPKIVQESKDGPLPEGTHSRLFAALGGAR
jgi:hypothetical protein